MIGQLIRKIIYPLGRQLREKRLERSKFQSNQPLSKTLSYLHWSHPLLIADIIGK